MESGKRLKVEVDRLSTLPDDLIYKILSYIDIVYSIRLSVVSSRWRFIWTSMPTLNFLSNEVYSISSPYREFVNKVLSARNNKIGVSSVSLHLAHAWKINHNVSNFKILECEFCHNLNELHLRDVKLKNCNSNLAMCQNLKYLTLKRCKVSQPDDDSGHFSITNSRLLSLTLKKVYWLLDFVYVCTPQLKHLIFVDNPHSEEVAYYDDYDDGIVSEFSGELAISAPGLTYLRIKGSYIPKLSLDGFPSLEKVDLCISSPQKTDVHKIHDMFQRFNSVIYLALSLEIVELLSTSKEVISHQPSPFTSLKSVKIYPLEVVKTIAYKRLKTYQLKSSLEIFQTQLDEEQEAMKIKLSAEVTNYLLNSISNATFTTVSYEEARAIKITKVAYRLMEDLTKILEEMEAKLAWQKTLADSFSDDFTLKVRQSPHTEMIFCVLNNIKILLTKVLASKRVEMQSCFSRLSTKSKTFLNKMVADIKNQWDMKQRIFSGYFDEIGSSS